MSGAAVSPLPTAALAAQRSSPETHLRCFFRSPVGDGEEVAALRLRRKHRLGSFTDGWIMVDIGAFVCESLEFGPTNSQLVNWIHCKQDYWLSCNQLDNWLVLLRVKSKSEAYTGRHSR